jgi:hypothetical protein
MLHQIVIEKLKLNFPIISEPMKKTIIFDLKTLTDIIDFNRNSSINSSFSSSNEVIVQNFKPFQQHLHNTYFKKKRGRFKNDIQYDEQLANNIVKAKHPTNIESFNNSSDSNDQRSKNNILKTKHPCKQKQFINESNSVNQPPKEIFKTKHPLVNQTLSGTLNIN